VRTASVSAEREGARLDSYLSGVSGLSRSKVQKLIADGLVLIDGEPARKNHLVSKGEKVSWRVPAPPPEDILPQEIPLTVVFKDEHLAVIDKPASMVMYPGPGHASDTLANALMALFPEMEGVGGRGRPGVFHRLDRGTSGLVAVALTEASFRAMVELMKERGVERDYTALITGDLTSGSGTIDAPVARSRGNRKRMAVDMVAGKRAVSRFKVVERFGGEFTLVEVSLDTGRTHQIRVHFHHIGHPVAGDPEYSRGRSSRELGLTRQFLHAHRLSFTHPMTGERVYLLSELPQDLAGVLDSLRGA
jgi:23S rRNA pseudouridine1911/1915/1917 synthase